MNELDKLRSLLLSEEIEQLSSIQDKLNKLSTELRTPEVIIEHLAPLFVSILKKSNEENEELILDTFSPIVNALIDKSYETSKEKISSQLAPLIGNAIREQIKSQKDDVVDALYPVIGNMISRYVTKSFEDMLNNINTQIQKGLSFKNISRKMRAKLQGVSETELLLKENTTTKIRAVLLIHKDTGTVLSEAQNPITPITEPEMISSMLTAIKSFVNDWVEKNEANYELGEIEYGGSKIIIETSGFSYLAVIINGAADTSVYEKIRLTMETIVLNNGDDIRNFNGNLSEFPNIEIYKKIATLLAKPNNEQLEKPEKRHPIIYIIPILIITFIGWTLYSNYANNSLNEKITKLLYKTPQLTSYRINTSVSNGVVTLSGTVPFDYHKQLASKIISDIKNIKNVKNDLVVIPSFDDPMQITSNISYLLKGLNADNGIDITYEYEYPNVTLIGSVWDNSRRKKILNKLKTIKGINTITDKVDIKPPQINEYILFENGSAAISKKYNTQLINLISILKQLDSNIVLQVYGYSDEHGTKKAKEYIAALRAKNVANYLKETGSIEQSIELDSSSKPLKGLSSKQARCVLIRIKEQR